jgi:flagellar assembly factor FliW
MKVETKWFGTIEIGEEKIITFTKGLMGFESCKRFTIIYDVEKEQEATIMWLQSVDNKDLALPVMKPEIVKRDYDPIVEDELINSLGSNIKDAELVVLVTLTVPSDLTKMTCNLKAPIIINADTMKGIQLIADNEDYMVKYPIYDILAKDCAKDGE